MPMFAKVVIEHHSMDIHSQYKSSKSFVFAMFAHIIYIYIYTLWLFNIAMEKNPFFIGKPSINGPFSMAMLNNQRVYIYNITAGLVSDSPN